ncbi:MAG: hypothetical protein ACOC9W_04475 [Persicimonas sp.]
MNFTMATIVLLQVTEQAGDAVNGSPDGTESDVGFVVPFEIVAIVVGVLVTFGLVYLVRRALHGDGEF